MSRENSNELISYFLVGFLFFFPLNIIQRFLNKAGRMSSTNLSFFLAENACQNCMLMWKSINSNKIPLWRNLRRLFWRACNGTECSDVSISVQPFLYIILKLFIVYKIKHEHYNESVHFLWKSRFQIKIIIILFQAYIPE